MPGMLSSPKRLVSAAMAGVMALTLIDVIAIPAAALAAGPSVALPDMASTSVTQHTPGPPRAPDQASVAALSGDQPSGPAAPGGAGRSTATSLAPSASWQVAPHTGDFTWSYPLRVPPAPGGLVPELSLSYASSAVDGRTSATNNQASWVGDGWDLSAGYIERVYGGCADDDMGGTVPPQTGDLCWRNDNATASTLGPLIAETGNLYRAKADDGSRIELLAGVANGDDNGEHWKVTTPDGTQYFYGSRPESSSTWTVPVYGDDVNEPCHGTTFATSRCVQAWRWNLDKVIDPFGNMMVYTYAVETNKYGANLQDAAVSYIRGGVLHTIDYGLRSTGSAPATGKVEFVSASRCVPGSDCVPQKRDNWPDVPWANQCDGSTCYLNYAPTFWTTKRLDRIVTWVQMAAGPRQVDSWTLEHAFPAPGDDEKAALWLKSIVHKGHAGTEIAQPKVTFEGTAKPNRVIQSNGVGPLNRYRITGVLSETGGALTVVYAAAGCAAGSMPASDEHNDKLCYPVRWAPPGGNERVDYFHKYVVAEVAESDRYEGTGKRRTAYSYEDGAAWHFDTSEFSKPAKKTYSEFRGFNRVRVRTGEVGDPAGPPSEQEHRYYRGMDGDPMPGNGTRPVTVTDSKGGSYTDSAWLAGTEYETTQFNGVTGPVVSTTITIPVVQGPSAQRGDLKSYLVRPGTKVTHTALAGQAWRTTRSVTHYDDRGLVIKTDDEGDLGVTGDEQCTRMAYTRNGSLWIIALPYRTWTLAARCTAGNLESAAVVTDVRTEFDGLAVGTAPVTGAITGTQALTESGYVTTSTTSYDIHGRPLSSKDALGNETTTSYTPLTGGPVTGSTVTNARGHTTVTTIDPAWGSPTMTVDPNGRKTETAYDALGRIGAVWLPNRPRNSNTASATFTYLVRNDGPVVVTTSRINALGTYLTTKEIYDALLRLRQTQAPAKGGGRVLTDTRYDTQGRAYFSTGPYFTDSAVDDNLWVASEVNQLSAVMTTFDGAGRKTATATRGGGAEKWRTTYAHAGDRITTTPPAGGTPFTAVTDVRGQLTELRQGSQPDVTRYTYTSGGDLSSIVDAAGNTWTYGYDLRGNLVSTVDPDKGPASMTYDSAQRLATATDARGVTLSYGYDNLSRPVSLSHAGTPLATWSYDTAGLYGKGLLASSTRHIDGAAYTVAVGSYSALSQPLSMRVSIPETEQGLYNTYTTQLRYDHDGGLASTNLPAIGDLPAEGIVHERDEFGLPLITRGGFDGMTIGYATGTEYTRFGELARVRYGEGAQRAWQSFYYDTHTRRLNRIINDVEAPAPMLSDVSYTYDPAGNITSLVDAPIGQPVDTQCFRYDYLRRLTSAWTPSGGCGTDPATAALSGPAPYRHSYSYDAVGNRLSHTNGAVTTSYGYPDPGDPQPHAVGTVTGPGGTDSYGYDEVGNMVTRPGQILDWDALGKLTKVTEGTGETTFVYDANGNRLLRRTPERTTLYLAGQELTLEKSTGALSAARYYTHAGRTVALRTSPTEVFWLMADHQGTSQVAVRASTMTVTQMRQTPFGVSRGPAANLPGERGFAGGTSDDSTGLVHLGAREYDAELGRFISVDPVMGSEPQLMNAYAYSNNSPVTFSDPTGLYCDSCDFYDHTRGESSVWSEPPPRTSFCDSCDYYSNRDGTHSAWNRKTYPKSQRPTVFKQSEEINKRRAAEERARDEARRKAEECARSFWCRAGNFVSDVVNSEAFSVLETALGVLAPVCPVCGAVSVGMSVLGAAVTCAESDAASCGLSIAGAVAGALVPGGKAAAKSADDMGDLVVHNRVHLTGDSSGNIIQAGVIGDGHYRSITVYNEVINDGVMSGNIVQAGVIGTASADRMRVVNSVSGGVINGSVVQARRITGR
jgi:RHS repeat-associated protein